MCRNCEKTIYWLPIGSGPRSPGPGFQVRSLGPGSHVSSSGPGSLGPPFPSPNRPGSKIDSHVTKTCPLATQGVSSCDARRHIFLRQTCTCLVVSQEDMSFVCHKRTCLLVSQEHMSSCGNKKKTSSYVTKHVFLCHRRHTFV